MDERQPSPTYDWTKLMPAFDLKLTYYLSGPMSGYPKYNYDAFDDAAYILRQSGIKLESPHENPWPHNGDQMDAPELWKIMMEKCFEQMERCQGIIMLKGWPQSRGARIEIAKGLDKNWPIYFFNRFMLTDMNS